MQGEDKQLPMNEISSGGEDLIRSQHRLAWIEGMIDSKHWPSLRILFSANLLLPILILGGSILASLIAFLWLFTHQTGHSPLQIVLLLSVSLALFSLILVLNRLRSQLLRPLASLEQTVNQVCEGEPVASKGSEQTGVLS
ncbi:MAG: hypothetical protein KZQ72_11155, partial [Candidatus Thiodiazotropha sp. (ex Cardiolucina cf. quadrata)]|nr:hypothetical protein [Candidatus Thiodiazotropha sp. (ex Cardiolucina cf. quadrata)]